jgi:ribosomal protein S18 acetylase RimI-like enzyme
MLIPLSQNMKDESLELGSESLNVRKVRSPDLLLRCKRYLAKDPIANVLSLGDLYQPLLSVSSIYVSIENDGVSAVCSVYHAYSTPSLVLGSGTLDAKRALIKEALGEVSDQFVSLCAPDEVNLFKEYSAILHMHPEQQMVTELPKRVETGDIKVSKVSKNDLGLLSEFYVEHHAEAWTPIQFQAGPYYCVKNDGRIVSAGGVHVVAPQIAQLGNIITDEAWRGRGFGTACTSAVAADLASKRRIISLFVRTDNFQAIRMYEKLGFCRARDIVFLAMRKKCH